MLSFVDVGNLCCVAAGIVGTAALVRERQRSGGFQTLVVTALVVVALWAVALSIYARSPYSPPRAHLLLAAFCLLPLPWLPAALCIGAWSARAVLWRWRAFIGATVFVSTLASLTMLIGGIDWVTGIIAEPVVVLTRLGLLAVMVSAVPMAAVLVILIRRMPVDIPTMPALWLGTIGQVCSFLWISLDTLWRGYLALQVLTSAAMLTGAASILVTAALLRGLPRMRPFAPSRRLVYGSAVASLLIAYVLAARFAFGWVVSVASAASPQLVPVVGFVALSGLALTLGSHRSRHRLWVAVGRHMFRGKHDYGEVWIQLTGLVSAASSVSDLVQQAAQFCCKLLCVPEVTVWLVDSAGRVSCVALATADGVPPRPSGDTVGSDLLPDRVLAAITAGDGASCANAVAAAMACTLTVDGRAFGFIAVGPAGPALQLDDEDRRVLGYVAAQLASALGLYRLGEEIADAREIGSFHRISAFVLHDLKNLVAQQSFVIENASRFRGDPEFVADALAAFEDSTNRMRALIGRLRSRETTESSGEAGCDAGDLIRELIAVPHIARRDGCSVNLVLPSGGQRCLVSIDRVALAQVLSNLLVNAVESLPADAGEVRVTVVRATRGWRIDVRDNGRGISEAFLRDHLFRPFRTTKETGFGIGLYECKNIVEAASGSIEIHSEEHAGTTVSVTLPALATVDGWNKTVSERPDGQTCSASC